MVGSKIRWCVRGTSTGKIAALQLSLSKKPVVQKLGLLRGTGSLRLAGTNLKMEATELEGPQGHLTRNTVRGLTMTGGYLVCLVLVVYPDY